MTVYGDFNCPSRRWRACGADAVLAARGYGIDQRAVQHDPAIAIAGEPVEGDTAAGLADEVATIAELSDQDVRLDLVAATTSNPHQQGERMNENDRLLYPTARQRCARAASSAADWVESPDSQHVWASRAPRRAIDEQTSDDG